MTLAGTPFVGGCGRLVGGLCFGPSVVQIAVAAIIHSREAVMTGWIIVSGLVLLWLVLAPLAALRRSAERTEAMMARLLAQQGIPWDTVVPPSVDVLSLASAGRSLDAIRAYRRQTGLDLKAAKAVVDGLSQQNAGR
jgi:hypothetical protein